MLILMPMFSVVTWS